MDHTSRVAQTAGDHVAVDVVHWVLVDLMKPIIDGLDPFLGRDPWRTNEFSPLDDTIVRLMVRRRPGELSLLVRVSPG